MAAPNFTLARAGENLQGVDERALFLKTYGGEVMTAFEESNVFGDRHTVRTLTSGS